MNAQMSPALAVGIVQRPVPSIPEVLHDNPLVHRVLSARGVAHRTDLLLRLADLPRPGKLPNIERAVERLLQARDRGERVLIVGDYDCDGATSSCVAMLGLAMLGFKHVDYVIPSRFEFGYGLSPAIVDIAHHEHQAELIVTVDNGVASVEGAAQATAYGIDVVVTDHHLAPSILPDAYAIVNPNLAGSQFESGNLAGVGVIFYTLLAVRAQLKAQGDACQDAPLQTLLDLVAIGTVADVVPLDGVNRILVEQGLRRIRAGKTRPGVLALLSVAGRTAENMTTQDIGFGIGPRLNAAGRLDDMRVGVQCLLSETANGATAIAQELQSLNQARQNIEADMRNSAAEQLDQLALEPLVADAQFGVCLKDETWHQGVIGILAGRIKESSFKPVVVFTEDDDEHLKGSARSIPEVHIRDVLQNIVTLNPGMISKFGGHAMAAGLTLRKDAYEDFQVAFNAAVKDVLKGVHSVRQYVTDGPLANSDLTLENAELLARVMPWGQGFEAPLFSDRFRLVSQKVVGTGHLKMVLEPAESGQRLDAIAFNQAPVADDGAAVQVVYALEANRFRDRCTLQLRVQHLEPCALR